MVVKSQRGMRPGVSPPPRAASLQVVVALLLLGAAIALASTLLRLGEQARAATVVETRVLGNLVIPDGPDARATALLSAARDAGSPLRRLHAQQRGEAPLVLPVPAHVAGDAARRWLESLAAALAEPALPARVEAHSGSVLAPKEGRVLDVEGTLDALADAVYRGRGAAQARLIVRPAPTTSLPLPTAIDITSVLGRAESALLDADPTRTHNLRVAARGLDGTLIAPGHRLDVRAQLAEPIAALRFRPGPVVIGTPDAIEAAIAQVMRTLHMALIDADMALLEEPFAPDAPGALPNLRLESRLRRPCVLSVATRDGRLHAAVRGAAIDAVDDPSRGPAR